MNEAALVIPRLEAVLGKIHQDAGPEHQNQDSPGDFGVWVGEFTLVNIPDDDDQKRQIDHHPEEMKRNNEEKILLDPAGQAHRKEDRHVHKRVQQGEDTEAFLPLAHAVILPKMFSRSAKQCSAGNYQNVARPAAARTALDSQVI